MLQEFTGSARGASGSRGGYSTSGRSQARASRLDPSLSDHEQMRRHALAPIDKAGAGSVAQREAWWFFRDLVQSACDAGASRDHLADDLGCDVGYLNGMMAAGDRRAPSAAHVIGLLLSPRVPEGAKRIVLEQMGVVAGVISHAKAGGLRKEAAAATTNPAAVAMTVGAETGDLARAIADAADARGDAGVEISRHEAKVIRREAGEAAAACARAGVTLGGVIDVSG